LPKKGIKGNIWVGVSFLHIKIEILLYQCSLIAIPKTNQIYFTPNIQREGQSFNFPSITATPSTEVFEKSEGGTAN
jgi:hypothetical protein